LQQILSNLISNAVKYSPPDTPIEIAAAPHAGSKSVEITVRDYGLGIPLNQQDLVFERFVRLERELKSKAKGNGLGLYLCRMLTQALGGKIWVESAGIPGEGSTFHVLLPVPVPEQVMAATKKMER
jgi:signal transduction histidine kinase